MNQCEDCKEFTVKGKGSLCKSCGGLRAVKKMQEIKEQRFWSQPVKVSQEFYAWQQRIHWWSSIHRQTSGRCLK